MKKMSEYDKIQIEQGLKHLINHFLTSISDMLSNEDYVEFDNPIGTQIDYITSATIYRDEDGNVETIEVRHLYEENGVLYSDDVEISELPINILYELWDYLKQR